MNGRTRCLEPDARGTRAKEGHATGRKRGRVPMTSSKSERARARRRPKKRERSKTSRSRGTGAPPAWPPPGPSLPEKERNRPADTAAGARGRRLARFARESERAFLLLAGDAREGPTSPLLRRRKRRRRSMHLLAPPALSARALSARALASVRRVRSSSATPRCFRGSESPQQRAPHQRGGKTSLGKRGSRA